MTSRIARTLVLVFALAVSASTVWASPAGEAGAKYPSGDITFIIPNAPGGGNDLTVRALIPGLKSALGVNVIPENKSAARGAVAALDITGGKPDGQKLYFNSITVILMKYGGVEVNLEGFQPVAQVVDDTGVVLVKADAPHRSLADLVAAAKKSTLKYGHNGVGSLWQLAGVEFEEAAGVKFQDIAYSGGGTPIMAALAAGEIDVAIVNPAECQAMISAGKIKPLATMGQARHPVLPDVPTAKEGGVAVTFPVWRGIFTTKGVSEQVLDTLDKAIEAATRSTEFQTYVKNSGLEVKFVGHREFSKFFEDQKRLVESRLKGKIR